MEIKFFDRIKACEKLRELSSDGKEGETSFFEALEKNPRQALNVRKFMNYYLPTTVKLLEQYRTLEGTGIEVCKLPELMAERGLKAPETCRVSFHDACYDRYTRAFGTAARELYPDAQLMPLAHERVNTMCCGGGGMVSAYAPAFCEYRRTQRLGEIDASDTDEVVSTCFSCVNSMQRSAGAKPVKHYLESVFGMDVDWSGVYASVDAFYADPQAMALLETDDPAL